MLAGQSFDGEDAMKNSVSAQADIFAPELSDDALELAAAVADRQRLTLGICTDWYYCNWPLSPAEQATVARPDA